MEQNELKISEAQVTEKPRVIRRRIGWIAAVCAILAAAVTGAVIGIAVTQDAPSPYPVFHRVSSAKILEIPEESDEYTSELFPKADYEKYGVSFEAEVLRIFPDPYVGMYRGSTRIHMAELLVKDMIAGDSVPQVIYLRLSKSEAERIRQKQTIVYSGMQVDLEGGSLLNAKTGRIESFGVTFSGTDYTSCIAVFADENDPEIENTKQRIRSRVASPVSDPQYRNYCKVLSLTDAEGALRQALEEIANPEIGEFMVTGSLGSDGEREFACIRFIDGYMTDEVITINIETGEVTYSDARYTAEDRSVLPNLKKLTKKVDIKKLEIPQEPEIKGKSRIFYKFNCTYRKVNGKIFGLIGLCWQDIKDSEWGPVKTYYSHPFSYKVYTPDGTFLDATEKELNSVLGIPQ